MLLEDKKVYVGKFIPRAARMKEMGEAPNSYKNVYVKNFDDALDDDKLKAMFNKFGNILSAKVFFYGKQIKNSNNIFIGYG